jgi:hypothetical protein
LRSSGSVTVGYGKLREQPNAIRSWWGIVSLSETRNP